MVSIPVIDLGGVIDGVPGAAEAAATELLAASKNAVFFYVENHGISVELMDAIIAEAARFHGLPMDEKMKVKVGKDLLGYLPPGGQQQRTSIYNDNTRAELSASFYMRREAPVGDPDGLAGTLGYFNNRWPDDLPGFRDTVLSYFDALDGLVQHLLPLFSIALGMGPRFFNDHEAFQPPNPNLRLLEYPDQDPAEENQFGIG
ncbi:MAG: isopenicillin N synthase family oxygenase, partial [Rhodospirillales bacterium]|nr:isopenicillin N synthase family oxygenase [Rhodospirillales bacterium]